MIDIPTERPVFAVAVDTFDGEQYRFTDEIRLWDRDGKRIRLTDVRDALTDPTSWIDFESQARWCPDQPYDDEPWKHDDDDEVDQADRPSAGRIYARGVVSVMVIYDDPV